LTSGELLMVYAVFGLCVVSCELSGSFTLPSQSSWMGRCICFVMAYSKIAKIFLKRLSHI
jgi:hypothetical protein